jgi:hypothetical protein
VRSLVEPEGARAQFVQYFHVQELDHEVEVRIAVQVRQWPHQDLLLGIGRGDQHGLHERQQPNVLHRGTHPFALVAIGHDNANIPMRQTLPLPGPLKGLNAFGGVRIMMI